MASSKDDSAADERFSYETRLVVLNFIGLLPSPTQLHELDLHYSGSSSSSSSGYERPGVHLDPSGSGSGGSGSWQQTLPSLPESRLIDKFMEKPEEDSLDSADLSSSEDEPDVSYPLGVGRHENEMMQDGEGVTRKDVSKSEPGKKTARQKSTLSPRKSRHEINVAGDQSQSQPERQLSEVSVGSDSTESSLMTSSRSGRASQISTRSSFIDVLHSDIPSMVSSGVLPPQVLPLKEQLNSEMNKLLKNKEAFERHSPPELTSSLTPPPGTQSGGVSPTPVHSQSVTTPETEVAEYLRQIGDTVQSQYGAELEQAVSQVLSRPDDQVDYGVVEHMATELLEHTGASGVAKTAMLMVLGQKLTLALIAKGKSKLSPLVDHTVKLVENHAAEYILQKGGWYSIVALEDESITDASTCSPTHSPQSDQGKGNSQTDSAFSADDPSGPASTSDSHGSPGSVLLGPGRGTSLDSISSIASGESVIEQDVVDKGAMTSQNGVHPAATGDNQNTSIEHQEEFLWQPKKPSLHLEEGHVKKTEDNSPDDSEDATTPPTASVETIRDEIRLLRQYSENIGNKRHADNEKKTWYAHVGLIGLVVAAIGLSFVLLKKKSSK